MTVDLFAYGVLMVPELLHALTHRDLPSQPAVLANHQRYTVRQTGYRPVPATLPEAGSAVNGMLIPEVDREILAVLDDFEEIAFGLYVRVTVPVHSPDSKSPTRPAQAYLAGPKLTGCLGDIWDPQAFAQFHDEYRLQIIPKVLRHRRAAE